MLFEGQLWPVTQIGAHSVSFSGDHLCGPKTLRLSHPLILANTLCHLITDSVEDSVMIFALYPWCQMCLRTLPTGENVAHPFQWVKPDLGSDLMILARNRWRYLLPGTPTHFNRRCHL